MSLTTKVLLRKDRKKVDQTYPLVIRVTYNRKVGYIPLGITLPEKDFDPKNQCVKTSSRLINKVTRFNSQIEAKRSKVYDCVSKLEDQDQYISLDKIKSYVNGGSSGKEDVFVFLEDHIDLLEKSNRQGNAAVYKQLKNKLQSQTGKEILAFEEIDYKFLKRWEADHFARDNSNGGLSVYLRTLRALYNKAIKEGVVAQDKYPFRDYHIKKGSPDRRALTIEEFDKLQNADLKEGSAKARACDLFMASFYLRGMNWKDMALLKVGEMQGDFERISYVRSKTKSKMMSIRIHPKLKEIIIKNQAEPFKAGDYVFPILNQSLPVEKHHETIKNKRKRLNGYLKTIAKDLQIRPFTIYAARHTYAMMLKRGGAPTHIIKDSLGHTTEEMTQTYLESFENTVLDEYDALIMK